MSAPPIRVFCSHRSVDKPRVLAVAERLRAAGLDAWVDAWEIEPGDDIVARINEGLAQADVALIFFSHATLSGRWVKGEISAITYRLLEDGRPVIPVMLDADAPVTDLLRPRARLAESQIDELIDAIYARAGKAGAGQGKPPLGAPRVTRGLRRAVLHVRRQAPAGLSLDLTLDGGATCTDETGVLGAGFAYSFAEFVNRHPTGSRDSAAERAATREAELQRLGDALGRALFPEAIDRALTGLLDHSLAQGDDVELCIQTAEAELLSIPFEAARLRDGRVPALVKGVRVVRRLATAQAACPPLRPGPLRILVAVGAPDEGRTRNAVLDVERELGTLFGAVDQARQYGQTDLRILEVGSPEQIRDALQEQPWHVLYLSGHGGGGMIELEDEDGAPRPAGAADLADAVRESGHPAPLVYLAACGTGLAASTETASLAQGLIERGVPLVVAMQTAVSDEYATRLAGEFFARLCRGEQPLASAALSEARREVEGQRRQALAHGEHGWAVQAEYATPALFSAGDEQPLLDRALPQSAMLARHREPAAGAVPMLSLGDLVGRRPELRQVLRVLRDPSGSKTGVQIVGLGGVGKSTLAGRAMQRLAEDGWDVATLSGAWTPADVAGELAALVASPDPAVADLAGALGQEGLDERTQFSLIARLLGGQRVLLVLDNFEDQLVRPGGAAFNDPLLEAYTRALLQAARRGRVLITSRYPVPGVDAWLARCDLGPLSAAQTAKLLLRLPSLEREGAETRRLIHAAIGGHPRLLEFLDGLLRQGEARLPAVTERLRVRASALGIDLERPALTLDAALADALLVGASDILLDELLAIVVAEAGDLEVLQQAAVFPRPVALDDLAAVLLETRPASPEAVRALRVRAARLVRVSLLTRVSASHVVVHRWTAELLRQRADAAVWRACCRRAGEFLRWDGLERSKSAPVIEEALRLLLAADEVDAAAELGAFLVDLHERWGHLATVAVLAREIAERLPATHGHWLPLRGNEADALLALGDTRGALERFQALLVVCEQRVADAPDRADFQRELSVSYERLGDLLLGLGQGEAARQFYEKSLAIAERLARQEPDRADFQRDLSVSYNKLGNLLLGLGQGEAARQFYEKDLAIAERLARQEPDRADFQRDLSVSYEKLGDLLLGLGQGEAARQFYEKALAIAERLARQEPDRADFQRDLSVSYEKLGNLLLGLGQGEAARQFYEKRLAIAERLARQEPDRADFQRDLSVSYNKLGNLLLGLGQGEAARQFYEKDLAIAERLARQEPDRADFQVDLVVSLVRIGSDNPAYLNRALTILKTLDAERRLMPEHKPKIAALERMLAG